MVQETQDGQGQVHSQAFLNGPGASQGKDDPRLVGHGREIVITSNLGLPGNATAPRT